MCQRCAFGGDLANRDKHASLPLPPPAPCPPPTLCTGRQRIRLVAKSGGNSSPAPHYPWFDPVGAAGTTTPYLRTIVQWADDAPASPAPWAREVREHYRRRRTNRRLLTPPCRRQMGCARGSASCSLSAASFRDITPSQKATADQASSLPTILRTTAGSERSSPITLTRTRWFVHARQNSSVYCAMSWQLPLSLSPPPLQWCHLSSSSLPALRHRYLPKHPCPDSICTNQ